MLVVRYHQKSQRRWTTSKFLTTASATHFVTTLLELLLVFRVEAADVLRVIPTNIVFRHLLGAGLPVCSRKERCPGCADSDHKFWLRYMKSYYGHCQNLKDEEFTEHLAFHQHFGIPVDHRRRPDGSSVLMMRSSQYGGYTPEKAAADHGNCCRISAVCVRSPHEPYADVYGVV